MTAQTWTEKDNTNEHAKLHGEPTRRPVLYMNNYRQLKKTGSRRGGSPGKTQTTTVVQAYEGKTHGRFHIFSLFLKHPPSLLLS